MYLTILSHPVFMNLDFHMPMIVDLSHPLIMLTGDNGCGKSTLLHSIYYAMKGEEVKHFAYDLKLRSLDKKPEVFLFDAEQHNPRRTRCKGQGDRRGRRLPGTYRAGNDG